MSTALAKYSAADFHRKAVQTAGVNVGSRAQPHYSTELCECEHWTDDEVDVVMGAHRAREAEDAPSYDREIYPQDSELGKYASDGAYEDDLMACPDCGCAS